jgi:hypothetical protein
VRFRTKVGLDLGNLPLKSAEGVLVTRMIGIACPLCSRSPVFSEKCDAMRVKTSPLFELARVLVRLDHVAGRVVNADHSIV